MVGVGGAALVPKPQEIGRPSARYGMSGGGYAKGSSRFMHS